MHSLNPEIDKKKDLRSKSLTWKREEYLFLEMSEAFTISFLSSWASRDYYLEKELRQSLEKRKIN